MGSSLSSRLDAKELTELQHSTAFTRDELLELYAQFRFLSDNQKTITRSQFELGLAAVGIGPQAPSPSSISSSRQVTTTSGDFAGGQRRPSGGEASGGGPPAVEEEPVIEFIRAPTEEDIQTLSRVEGIVFRLYDALYEQAHDSPVPKNPADDKGLSFDAFCAALSTLVSPRASEQLEALFRLFDENGDDFITERELARALAAINALLELPEMSTAQTDSPAQAKERARQFAAEVVRTHGKDGQLTLPQFRRAVSTHPVLRDIGQKIVNDTCADFFHTGKSPMGSAKVSPADPPLGGPVGHALATTPATTTGGHLNVSSSNNDATGIVGRRTSFLAAPTGSTAYTFARETDHQEASTDGPAGAQQLQEQPPLHRCSLSHVVVHCHPRETMQQMSYVAQRHRAEFHHRASDRYLHLVIVERPPDALAPAPAEITALHKEALKAVGGGPDSHVHVAVKPVTVKHAKEGIADGDFEDLLLRFLNANPSNVVRLPFGLRGSATAHVAAKFDDLALFAGHGFPMVTPQTAPTAAVRRMRNFIFCAERSKASERAARLIGSMMDRRYRDLCVVETLWNVSLSSVGHAVSDSTTDWNNHLKALKERSLKVAEHFRAKVAHGAAWAQTAEELGVLQSEVAKEDPQAAAAFAKAYEVALRAVAVAAAEEKEWDASVVKLLQRAGLTHRMAETRLAHPPEPEPPRSETVFVLGFQSRSMAKKIYASAMAYLCDHAHSNQAARESVSFIFVN